jgi:hypothetical protein
MLQPVIGTVVLLVFLHVIERPRERLARACLYSALAVTACNPLAYVMDSLEWWFVVVVALDLAGLSTYFWLLHRRAHRQATRAAR